MLGDPEKYPKEDPGEYGYSRRQRRGSQALLAWLVKEIRTKTPPYSW